MAKKKDEWAVEQLRYITAHQATQIRDWIRSGGRMRGKWGDLHRLAVAILLESALRVSEVIGGPIKGHEYWPGLLHEQYNPLDKVWVGVRRLKRADHAQKDAACDVLTQYVYKHLFPDPVQDGAVFPKEFTRLVMYRYTVKLGDNLGINRKDLGEGAKIQVLGPHSLRHNMGLQLRRQGEDLQTIRKALGQVSLSSAVEYADATDGEGLDAIHRINKGD